MELNFNPVEIRILGVLIEKQITTPEYYPLTLNSMSAACNQKSNRFPLMNLSEEELQKQLDRLQLKHLVQKISFSNSRVPRYQHLFDEVFKPTIKEKAVLCELFIRGPQTAGELRNRCLRMYSFTTPEEVEAVLKGLAEKAGGPYVLRLERQTGQKECRYAHLFCGEPDIPLSTGPAVIEIHSLPEDRNEERIAALEEQVAHLTEEMEALKVKLASLLE